VEAVEAATTLEELLHQVKVLEVVRLQMQALELTLVVVVVEQLSLVVLVHKHAKVEMAATVHRLIHLGVLQLQQVKMSQEHIGMQEAVAVERKQGLLIRKELAEMVEEQAQHYLQLALALLTQEAVAVLLVILVHQVLVVLEL
jgi:hypothetical protein